MVKRKIDNRIRVMIENGVKLGHRTMFMVIGDKARDQVPILYDILSKSTVKARPTVLWCYKNKDEAISNHGKKRLKKITSGKIDIDEADLFDTFRVSTTIHGRYYSETHSILGRTYGVCVLQDFEALTPNLLARTIETVEGGGLIIFLLKTIQSLKQLYTMSMDVHKRYRTEAHQTITCRFNERLILSLTECKRCLVVNDELTILPLSSKIIDVQPVNPAKLANSENAELLKGLKESLRDTPPAGQLLNLCKTYDQAKAVARFIEILPEKQLKPPLTLTAARGRGKSAAMGLATAAAIAFGYVNVYVTSPHPENLLTLFEFVLKGFDALEYHEHTDYTIIRSTNPDYKKAIIRINCTRSNRQTVQYIAPNDTHLLNAADLLLIDEAAAIPLPLVKKMLGPYLIFMSSTINGYEGTGRSLSLKLMSELQRESNAPAPINLNESIRYTDGDDIEKWIIDLLCLDATAVTNIYSGCPMPSKCELYYIDRDALFSYHKAAESFLHRLVAIYVSAHYKNSPNDLQMMSDAPAHHLFCLLGPIMKKDQLPEVLVVIQVALEGGLSPDTVNNSLGRGRKASGDLIPWNIAEQFGDREFPKQNGVRVVRIATHPNYQGMGYGSMAMQQLIDYYSGKFTNLEESGEGNENVAANAIEEVEEEVLGLLKEEIHPKRHIPVLLKRLNERPVENIDYIGVSFGLTKPLLKFWKSLAFIPIYLSQKSNDLTGEHTCIALHNLNQQQLMMMSVVNERKDWLSLYYNDFRRRFLKLLAKTFREFPIALSLSLLENRHVKMMDNMSMMMVTKPELDLLFLPHDLQRLEQYTNNQIEFRLMLDLTADLGHLYFQGKLQDVPLDVVQKAILLGMGVQGKVVDTVAEELNMPGTQILAKFYDCIKKITKKLNAVVEEYIADNLATNRIEKKTEDDDVTNSDKFKPLDVSLADELNEMEQEFSQKQKKKERAALKLDDSFKEYKIKGSEKEWSEALVGKTPVAFLDKKLISIKSGMKRLEDDEGGMMNTNNRRKSSVVTNFGNVKGKKRKMMGSMSRKSSKRKMK